jgi:glycosyltransferase involved in cell wall biosynthesis
MRVVVVAPPWFDIPPTGYGGIERVCYSLVEGLVELGHEVTLVASGSNHTHARFVPALDQPASGLGTEFQPVQEVRYAAGVARALRDVDADVVHDHSLAGPLVALCRSAPTLVTVHSPADGWFGDYFRRLALPLVAVSEFQRRAAPDLPWAATIPHGVDISEYPYRSEKDDFVLFLGRLSPEKGAHLALDAALKAGVKLIVAGKCSAPAERRYFEEYVAPRLGADAEFVGEIYGSQRVDLLARACGVLVPSPWNEPFGLASVEALACGTPVIGLRRGSLPEIVDHGLTGWICDDPAELAHAIRRLGDLNPQACRDVVVQRYQTAMMVGRYESVYRRLVTEAP